MPNYWLLKTEPSTYSFSDLERDRTTRWDGVANALALKYIRAMRKGDLAFIYHSGVEKQIVGIAEVASDPYFDPTSDDSRSSVIDLKMKQRQPHPVSLDAIKADKLFTEPDANSEVLALLRMRRLSVMPVSAVRWQRAVTMAQKSAGKTAVRKLKSATR